MFHLFCPILILDKIKWNSKPHSPEIEDEAAGNSKRAIFPCLIWVGGGSKFVIYFVQYCTELHIESPHDCIIINNHEPGFVSGSGVRGGFINDGL